MDTRKKRHFVVQEKCVCRIYNIKVTIHTKLTKNNIKWELEQLDMRSFVLITRRFFFCLKFYSNIVHLLKLIHRFSIYSVTLYAHQKFNVGTVLYFGSIITMKENKIVHDVDKKVFCMKFMGGLVGDELGTWYELKFKTPRKIIIFLFVYLYHRIFIWINSFLKVILFLIYSSWNNFCVMIYSILYYCGSANLSRFWNLFFEILNTQNLIKDSIDYIHDKYIHNLDTL